ncbi:actin-related protein 2/3 complex subunit 5-B-like [Lineus longissimus]|uniref:actin-related protein 2/3 complex subunit 5-B-like n=1 Tax=Lineus longissimus TaxID=88925 RepID=UPI002B4D0BD5
MSKASNSTKFRQVNVDEFNEDNFQDEQLEETDNYSINESEVNELITVKKLDEALKIVLDHPPVNVKDKRVKEKVFSMFLKVLSCYKSSDVERAVKSLDSARLDVLMKYIYRGFEDATENSSAILLTFHEKVVAVGGLGCIVRVLTDRKKV